MKTTFDEKKVIQDLLRELVYFEEVDIPPLINSNLDALTEEIIYNEYSNTRNESASLKSIIIDDTLRFIQPSEGLIMETLVKQGGGSEFESRLIGNLLAIKNEKKLDIGEIEKQNGFNIYSNKDNIAKMKFDGFLTFSNFVYDEDKNLGCFYCKFVCGSECGTENVIFFKKITTDTLRQNQFLSQFIR